MSGPRLSIIPARACTDPALKPRDLQVLCVLGRHTDDLGWCRKSQVKMAVEMGCARSTVFEAVERLVKAGYVERHVQVEDSGRDSPHVFRVLLDPVHPNPGSIGIDYDGDDADAACDDEAENAGAPPCRYIGTPAGIPAPPAGPGPAPKNDPFRTIERDARAEGEKEDPKKVEAEGWALLKNWPGFDGMPKDRALAFWMTMPADERATARRRFLPWRKLLRKQAKSHVPAPSTYLKERLWEAVGDPADAPAPPPVVKPFGKPYGARRMALLISGPCALPEPRGVVAQLIAQGGDAAAREQLAHRARHGWPEVNRMHEAAAIGRGVTLKPGAEPPAAAMALMEAVQEGTDLWSVWREYHGRMGWPWLPDPGARRWVWMPAGGPDGLAAFEAALRGGRLMADMEAEKDDDGGGREAAE